MQEYAKKYEIFRQRGKYVLNFYKYLVVFKMFPISLHKRIFFFFEIVRLRPFLFQKHTSLYMTNLHFVSYVRQGLKGGGL